MGLAEMALRHLKGRRVVVVSTLKEDDLIQELGGVLIDGEAGCLVLQEEEETSPTIVNAAFVAWVYEDTGQDEGGDDEEDAT